MSYEERLGLEAVRKTETAILAFRRKKRKTRNDEHRLYEKLTNLGLTSEEADEMINMEVSDES